MTVYNAIYILLITIFLIAFDLHKLPTGNRNKGSWPFQEDNGLQSDMAVKYIAIETTMAS